MTRAMVAGLRAALIVAFASCAGSRPVPARVANSSAAERFGSAGQLVPGGIAVFAYDEHFDSPSLILVPSVGYFVVDDIAVGVAMVATSSRFVPSSPRFVLLGIETSLAYNISLSDRLGLLPKLTIGYHLSFRMYGTDARETDSDLPLVAEAPVLFHVAPHFFIGGGPQFTMPSALEPRHFYVRLASVIGGWF